MKLGLITMLALGAATIALPAAAQRNPQDPNYVGANAGQGDFKVGCTTAVACVNHSNAWKAFVGHHFSRSVAAELGYANLGKQTRTATGFDASLGVTAWELSALVIPGNRRFSPFARLGVYRSEAQYKGDM